MVDKEFQWLKYFAMKNLLEEQFLEACSGGNLPWVKELVSRGVDIHTGSALILASNFGHIEVVKYLVENGADIHVKYDYALISASLRGHIEVVKYLENVALAEDLETI